MPRAKQRTLPPKITNYLRVLVHRIKAGRLELPIKLYLSKTGTSISSNNQLGWTPLLDIDDISLVDFEVLYSDIEFRIGKIRSLEPWLDSVVKHRLAESRE